MRLFIASKVVIILDYIANLFYYVKLTILYRIIKLQLNKLLFIIKKDKDNIFLVFSSIEIFSILLLR